MHVALDFDGTLVTHEYPDIGEDVGAVPYILSAQLRGVKFILYTMRDGEELQDAVKWCEDKGINLVSVNDNAPGMNWSASRKVYAHKYIDDAALGVPLVYPDEGRPYVDWKIMGKALHDWLDDI